MKPRGSRAVNLGLFTITATPTMNYQTLLFLLATKHLHAGSGGPSGPFGPSGPSFLSHTYENGRLITSTVGALTPPHFRIGSGAEVGAIPGKIHRDKSDSLLGVVNPPRHASDMHEHSKIVTYVRMQDWTLHALTLASSLLIIFVVCSMRHGTMRGRDHGGNRSTGGQMWQPQLQNGAFSYRTPLYWQAWSKD